MSIKEIDHDLIICVPTENDNENRLLKRLARVANKSLSVILTKNREYGESWKKRGGAGAFFMLARKWDGLEPQVAKYGYDIFKAIEADKRVEGIIDDIKDLSSYLLLVLSEYEYRKPTVMSGSLTEVKLPKEGFVSHGYQPEISED